MHSPYRGNVRRIALFGSQLHGDANTQSDIDLLIEFSRPMSMLKIVRMERELSDALGSKVDLSTPMSLSKYFRSDVLREAESIFEAVT
ncbi:nucleotidyltransferase family protein [Candidatus Peregrinibacteria bacterium]|nr:nucleotidyltransferase family protein [Candidatus Peregrinibacteria bacterium]